MCSIITHKLENFYIKISKTLEYVEAQTDFPKNQSSQKQAIAFEAMSVWLSS